jgi:hypothetical protein
VAIKLASLLIDMQANVARLQADMNRAANIVERSTNQMQRSLRRITNIFTLGLGATALVRGVGSLVQAAKQAEAEQARLTATIRAQGHAAGFTRLQLEAMNDELTRTTQFDSGPIRSAQAELIKFGNIHGDVFRDALKIAADYAAFTGSDMPDAAQKLGRALAAPHESVGVLEKELGKLTKAQKDAIDRMVEHNDVAGAQAAVLDIVRGKIGGTAELMNVGYTKAVADAAKAWEAFKTAVANVPAGQGVLGSFFKFLTDSLNDIAAILERGTWLDSLMFLLGFRGGGISAVAPHAREFAALNEELVKLDESVKVAEQYGGRATEQQLKRREEILKRLNAIQDELGGKGAVKPPRLTEDPGSRRFAIPAPTPPARWPGERGLNVLGLDVGFFHEQFRIAAKMTDDMRANLLGFDQEYFSSAEKRAAYQRLEIERTRELAAAGKSYLTFIELETALMEGSSREKQDLIDELALVELGLERGTEALNHWAEAVRKARDRQDELRASFAHGIRSGADSLVDEAANIARQSQRLFENTFRGMEDALVEFVKTGKFEFRDFASSIIEELFRIQIQSAIIGPLAGLFQGFGTTSGTTTVGPAMFPQNIEARQHGGPVTAYTPYIVGESGPELFVPRTSGQIVPNAGMGNVTIVQHINIDSRSDQASIVTAMIQAKEAAKAEIRNEFYRGGRVAAAAGTR